MKKKCITNVVTDAGNQGQLPWLATLVTKVTTMVTTDGYYDGYYDGYHNQPWLPRLRNRLLCQALSLIYVSKSAKETIWIAINLVFFFYEGLMTELMIMGNNNKYVFWPFYLVFKVLFYSYIYIP